MPLGGGALVADFAVRIDRAEWEFQAAADLCWWLERDDAGPGGERLARQQRTVDQVGDWIGGRMLGRVAAALDAERPCAVLVTLPAELEALPLELARVNGRVLALRDVSFVVDTGAQRMPAGVTGPLRVLGLFSLPENARSLNLRKERFELERLAGTLSGSGRDVELRTLQYGTTRERLTDALTDGDGWDVVHLSGHGRPGAFVLERADGRGDPVGADEIVSLLSPLRGRVRLVTVASCESAERTGRRLALAREMEADDAGYFGGISNDDDSAGTGDGAGAGLAARLARELDCAALGMRYPVTESFAAAFAGELYRLMFDKGNSLARARAMATAALVTGPATVERPPPSAGVCVLYGASALGLRLVARARDEAPAFGHQVTKLAAVPAQPARFVGRVRSMARAAEALAAESGRSAVVIEGMAGIGKSALARELVYTQRDNFRAVIWHGFGAGGPAGDGLDGSDGSDGRDGLDGLAGALRDKITGLDPAPLRAGDAEARAFTGRLASFFASQRVLVVLDNADAQLTDGGHWRDERLGLLTGALGGHGGLGKVIVTTRRPLGGPPAGNYAVVERLGPLSAQEAILLAGELPGLRRLLDGDAPPARTQSARRLARGVLGAARGHPGLLRLAEELSADPAGLLRLVLAAEGIWTRHGTAPDGTAPGDRDDEAGHLAVLDAWTEAASAGGSG